MTNKTFLVAIIFLCSCSYNNTKSKDNKDSISKIGFISTNGYSGTISMFISKDSINFLIDQENRHVKIDTTTNQKLWLKLDSLIDLNVLSKIQSKPSNQPKDGTDQTIFIQTQKDLEYSVRNVELKELGNQKELVELLLSTFDNFVEKSKAYR
jgi:hypothetical protein